MTGSEDDTLELLLHNGETRILGCRIPAPDNPNLVGMPVYEDHHVIWTDDQIKAAITDPTRKSRRQIFDKSWILNQKSHGSCNGYALAALFGKTRWMRGVQDGKKFSGSYIYSRINGGNDNGSAVVDDFKAISQYGTVEDSVCPWNLIYRKDTTRFDSEAKKHVGLNGYIIKQSSQLSAAGVKQAFRSAVAQDQFVVVVVHADNAYADYKSGPLPVNNGPGNHANHVDQMELINGVEVFSDNNNWGTGWGQDGIGQTTWANYAHTAPNHGFMVLTSTTEAGVQA